MVPVSLTLSPRRPAPADRAALVEAVEGLTAEHAAVAHVYVGAPADGPVRVVLFLNLSAPAGQQPPSRAAHDAARDAAHAALELLRARCGVEFDVLGIRLAG
jgi:hypothetical protein